MAENQFLKWKKSLKLPKMQFHGFILIFCLVFFKFSGMLWGWGIFRKLVKSYFCYFGKLFWMHRNSCVWMLPESTNQKSVLKFKIYQMGQNMIWWVFWKYISHLSCSIFNGKAMYLWIGVFLDFKKRMKKPVKNDKIFRRKFRRKNETLLKFLKKLFGEF